MSSIRIFGAAAAVALIAAPAFAASPAPAAPDVPAAYPDQTQRPAAYPAENAAVNTSGVVLLSSPTPRGQAYMLKAGDPTVVSNAPIADTRANRARYGQPMSNAGRRTAPVGN